MKLSNPIPIDLFEFVAHGKFDCIRPGLTKTYILHNFPDPDGLSEQERLQTDIWTYGSFEFHFVSETLYMVFTDCITSINGGPSLTIEPWIFGSPRPLRLHEACRKLNERRLDYATMTEAVTGHSIIRMSVSGVELAFAPEEEGENPSPADPNDFGLVAISLGGSARSDSDAVLASRSAIGGCLA